MDGDRDTTSLHCTPSTRCWRTADASGIPSTSTKIIRSGPFRSFNRDGQAASDRPVRPVRLVGTVRRRSTATERAGLLQHPLQSRRFYDGTSYAWETNWGGQAISFARRSATTATTWSCRAARCDGPAAGARRLVVQPADDDSGAGAVTAARAALVLVEHPFRDARPERTGFFVVYNERRDTLDFAPETLLGRSITVIHQTLRLLATDSTDYALHDGQRRAALRQDGAGSRGDLQPSAREDQGIRTFTEDPNKSSIHLVNRTIFAGVATRQKVLLLTLKAERDICSPRIEKHDQVSANRWHLRIRLSERERSIGSFSGG